MEICPVTLPDFSIYFSDNFVTLDFETDTSHGDYGHAVHKANGLVLASWKVGHSGPLVSKFGSEFEMDELVRAVEAADFLVAHNAKYELGWLLRCGVKMDSVVVFDTKIAEYVLLGNLAAGCKQTGLPPRSTSLDMCCRRRGWKIKDPIVDKLMHYGINPVYIPRPWLKGRCEQDVQTTYDLFVDQRRALFNTQRLPVLHTRCLFTPVLADMEFQGMFLDADRVNEQYVEYSRQLVELSEEFDLAANGVNWKSPQQVAKFLYNDLGFDELRNRAGEPIRTKGGKPKADQGTVDKLKAKTAEQREFLKLRKNIGKVNAALTKSLQFFQGVCAEYGQTFYAVFNQTVTATHRLSSSGHQTWFDMFQDYKTVQFQNMARIFKRLFRSRREGWLMMEVDGSQLEFRVAADLGNDKQALADITDPNFDAHCMTASIINNIPYDEFLNGYRNESSPEHKRFKSLRTAAKAHTFKPLYGGESGTKKEKRWYKGFKERYRGIAEAQEAWVEQVLATKRLITAWGMRYYWPRAKRGHDGYVNVKSSVYNYPVQAFATAEIIPIAVTYLWHRLRPLVAQDKVKVVNTVHDSVILEVHPEVVDTVREIAIQCFGNDTYQYLRDVYNYEFKVPLGCGITVGTHWSEGAEESYNIWPDGKVERVT